MAYGMCVSCVAANCKERERELRERKILRALYVHVSVNARQFVRGQLECCACVLVYVLVVVVAEFSVHKRMTNYKISGG